MQFLIGDIVQLVIGGEKMVVIKVEPGKITAVARGGARWDEHPRNFTLVEREKVSEDE